MFITISIYSNLNNNFFFFFYSKYPSVICSKIFQWPLNYLFRWSLLSTWLLRLLVTWTSGFALLPPLRKILHFLVLNFVQVTLGPVCVCLSPSLLHTPDPLIAACFTSFKEPFTPLPRSLSKLLNILKDSWSTVLSSNQNFLFDWKLIVSRNYLFTILCLNAKL